MEVAVDCREHHYLDSQSGHNPTTGLWGHRSSSPVHDRRDGFSRGTPVLYLLNMREKIGLLVCLWVASARLLLPIDVAGQSLRGKSVAGQNWTVTVQSIEDTGEVEWRLVTPPTDPPRYNQIPTEGLVFWRLKLEARSKAGPNAEFESRWIQVRYRDRSGNSRVSDMAAAVQKNFGDAATFGSWKLTSSDGVVDVDFLFAAPKRADVAAMSLKVLDYPEISLLP